MLDGGVGGKGDAYHVVGGEWRIRQRKGARHPPAITARHEIPSVRLVIVVRKLLPVARLRLISKCVVCVISYAGERRSLNGRKLN